MNPETLRDLRVALLVHLYRVYPYGRPAATLHRLVRKDIECSVVEVNAQLGFLQGRSFASEQPADDLAPGLDPYWFITSAGMTHCEEKGFV